MTCQALIYRESHGEDISDWLAQGNTLAQLLDIVEKTPEYVPAIEPESTQENGRLRLVSIEELFALELPPREMLLAPFLPRQGLVSHRCKKRCRQNTYRSRNCLRSRYGRNFFTLDSTRPKEGPLYRW